MRTVPPRMPSQSSSSVSTWSVVRTSLTVPPTSAARLVAVGVALRARAGRDAGSSAAAARDGSRGTRPRPPGPTRRARRGRATRAISAIAALGVGQVVDEERAERDVERAVIERQRFGVGAHEVDVGVAAARFGEHALGEVDAGDARAARGRRGGQRSRAAADVEHAHPGTDRGGVEQRLDRERGRARHQRVVRAGAGAPAVAPRTP